MFNRMEGFTSAVGDKTTADLNEYRVTLFNLIIRIYDLLSQEAFVHDGLNANPVVPISPLSAKKIKKVLVAEKSLRIIRKLILTMSIDWERGFIG